MKKKEDKKFHTKMWWRETKLRNENLQFLNKQYNELQGAHLVLDVLLQVKNLTNK